jgi:hypothetical protein
MKEKRIDLEGKSREFFDRVLKNSGLENLKVLSKKTGISYSTLKKYCGEYLLMPRSTFQILCNTGDIGETSFNYKIKDGDWGQIKGGKRGIEVLMQKYKEEIPSWRKKAIQNSSLRRTKKIKTPPMSEALAEFIGIHLGDGSMTKHFIRISGDYRYDIPYFEYISNLVKKLFGIEVQILKDPRPINTGLVLIRSKEICSLLNKRYNIPFGNKILNGAKIPSEIMEDKELSLACLRGLIDTDGTVSRRGTKGKQFCVEFRAHNKILLSQVNEITKKNNLFTHFYETCAGTNSWNNILAYFKFVGSSNLRHIVRFNERVSGNTIYQKDVLDYYKKDLYKNINLPFKGLVI